MKLTTLENMLSRVAHLVDCMNREQLVELGEDLIPELLPKQLSTGELVAQIVYYEALTDGFVKEES